MHKTITALCMYACIYIFLNFFDITLFISRATSKINELKNLIERWTSAAFLTMMLS